jgi:hypothetical protein
LPNRFVFHVTVFLTLRKYIHRIDHAKNRIRGVRRRCRSPGKYRKGYIWKITMGGQDIRQGPGCALASEGNDVAAQGIESHRDPDEVHGGEDSVLQA